MPADSEMHNASQVPTNLSLPPPQVFDILPALHELLARIERAPIDSTSDLSQPTPEDSTEIGAHYQDQPPLEPKDVPTEALAIKTRIRRALKELDKLPDMESSVEEQEEEIAELEARVERQRAMLRRFGEMGQAVGKG